MTAVTKKWPVRLVLGLLILLVLVAIAAMAIFAFHRPPPVPHPKPDLTLQLSGGDGGGGWSGKDFAVFLTSIISAIVAAGAVLVSMINTNNTTEAAATTARTQRQRDANKSELEKLQGQIAAFHVPYLIISQANNNMAQDLRHRLADPNYRMLISLFDPKWLSSLSRGDQTLVREICATGLRLRTFIEEKSGGLDPGLTEHLARASTHFRVLWLAFRRRLGTDPTPYERYVYPTQLDVAVSTDLTRLENRIALLRKKPDEAHPPIDALILPKAAELPAWPNPPRPPGP